MRDDRARALAEEAVAANTASAPRWSDFSPRERERYNALADWHATKAHPAHRRPGLTGEALYRDATTPLPATDDDPAAVARRAHTAGR